MESEASTNDAVREKSVGWATTEEVYEQLITVYPDGRVVAHHDALDRVAESYRGKECSR